MLNLARLPRRLNPAQALDLLRLAKSDRLLSLLEAAEQLGVGEEQVRQWVEADLLPFRLVGGTYVFELVKLIEWQLRGLALVQGVDH
jgi:excisionase family DNA binding protein